MKSNTEIKLEAKKILHQNFGKVFVAFLPLMLLFFVSSIPSFIQGFNHGREIVSSGESYSYSLNYSYGFSPVLSLVISIVSIILIMGIQETIINNKPFTSNSSFKYFNSDKLTLILKVAFFVTLFEFLWALIPIAGIIISIIKTYAYSLSLFLIIKNESFTKSTDYITCSRKMMNGNKAKYFSLHFSFIGWFLLSLFTFGLSLLYSIPYLYIANTLFLDEVYKQNKNSL